MRFRTLLVLVSARLILHALYVPPFEGPDEPFHLAHVGDVWHSDVVDAGIVAAIQRGPCSADLHRAFGCRRFGAADAVPIAVTPVMNYEAHQPPLFYAAAHFIAYGHPVTRLLVVRLFAVALTIMGLCISASLSGCC